ncbi:hypothetical protein, partial [Micromonospora sp. LOL_024]|uniref:hypothetical protein n=1 Tax=Micromonospora sp. LOL_024 TaxID=3345412 RepID=UPI003A876835
MLLPGMLLPLSIAARRSALVFRMTRSLRVNGLRGAFQGERCTTSKRLASDRGRPGRTALMVSTAV